MTHATRAETLAENAAAGELLTKLRKALGLTQMQLAARLGVTKSYISWVEQGYGRIASDRWAAWAAALEASPHALACHLMHRLDPTAAALLKLPAPPLES